MTHTYVCRESCGCAVLLILDKADKRTGRRVGRAIAEGLTVERVPSAEVRSAYFRFGHSCERCATPVEQLEMEVLK